jgi:hypothetical protein
MNRIYSLFRKIIEMGPMRLACRHSDIPPVDKQIICKTCMNYRHFVSWSILFIYTQLGINMLALKGIFSGTDLFKKSKNYMLLPLTGFGLSWTHPLIECNVQSKRHHCKRKGPKGVIISSREDGPGSLQSSSPHSSFSPWGLLGTRGGQSVSSTSACSDNHSWTTQE